ncbi:31906_t:CDS:2 [Gigaspora margarita]|uniref:31906_t:CDS:1 n=1 Tax=Gigaspora margarita TaxID=4874 RepID=A0ABN7UR71_GIGMA|nr:31906_t:CDS:2 [Gigaspora margarita]
MVLEPTEHKINLVQQLYDDFKIINNIFDLQEEFMNKFQKFCPK